MRYPKPRKRLEGSIEVSCVGYAKMLGFLARKMNGSGFRAWPDRLLIGPPCAPGTLWVEFKRKGEESTAAQATMHEELRFREEDVWVCDDVAEFKAMLDEWVSKHLVVT